MHYLSNSYLQIAIKNTGAELCGISSVKHKTPFMWNADPTIWGSHAPNLFPIIGSMKDNTYIFKGRKYPMTKHGFVRNNTTLTVVRSTKKRIVFKLETNEALYAMYPFKFEFFISYRLKANRLIVKHEVKNIDTKPLYFSLGGHPAFKCPVYDNETYDSYSLDFEHTEKSKHYMINMNTGLLTNKTSTIFNNSNRIKLHYDLFNKDALVFKDLKSKRVSLTSSVYGKILTVNFKDFKALGIWAKPNANYVCIEPWLGYADHEDTNQDITEKKGIIKLKAGCNFKAAYSIKIHKAHLV